jgi:hypothetical protein
MSASSLMLALRTVPPSFAWIEDPSLFGAGKTVIALQVTLEAIRSTSTSELNPKGEDFDGALSRERSNLPTPFVARASR